MLCPIKVNSNTIELPVHTSCYCALDLLRVTWFSILWRLDNCFSKIGVKDYSLIIAYSKIILSSLFHSKRVIGTCRKSYSLPPPTHTGKYGTEWAIFFLLNSF